MSMEGMGTSAVQFPEAHPDNVRQDQELGKFYENEKCFSLSKLVNFQLSK